MKKALRGIFHFLGSVHFAITLIGFTALFVLFGTLIESKTSSHRFASFYTYKHPAFLALLFFFFINILFAALRRWPFRVRHIPFLITHLGLLMILAGTAIKQVYGVQGAMSLLEGSGGHEVLKEETYVLRIEKKADDAEKIGFYDLKDKKSPFSELGIELLGLSPNSQEDWETWIKGNRGSIAGLDSFPVFTWQTSMLSLPLSGKIRLLKEPYPLFNLYAIKAIKADKLDQVIKQCYTQAMQVRLKDRSGRQVYEGMLQEVLEKPLIADSFPLALNLELGFTSASGFQGPKLLAEITPQKVKNPWKVEIPLMGARSLLNEDRSKNHFGKAPLQIDLEGTPFLLIIQDSKKDTHLVSCDRSGQVFAKSFAQGDFKTLAVYDHGFGGYAIDTLIPFSTKFWGRESKEKKIDTVIREEFEKASINPSLLAPPLKLLFEASTQANLKFPETLLSFLEEWEASNSWIFPDENTITEAIQSLDWTDAPSNERKAAFWSAHLFQRIAPHLMRETDPQEILSASGWPVPLDHEPESLGDLIHLFIEQLFLTGPLLPEPEKAMITNGAAFSAYLLAYGITKSSLIPPLDTLFSEQEGISLETRIARKISPLAPQKKLEENIPAVTLKFKKDGREEIASFSYDKTASKLAWPIMDGAYLVRFQPASQKIPVHVRLKQARQINYPGEIQAFSYESDLLLTDLSSNQAKLATLSMNRVYETKEGYRLYLAGIHPPNETDIKRIQLIVNYDPAKYLLTYPGGFFVSCGILLLFWFVKRKNT